uniref:Uncharacterized protein n=1 Tax=Romanomermis culicivorax TaxID=13658 RepID=A0A915K7E6_ROMCU
MAFPLLKSINIWVAIRRFSASIKTSNSSKKRKGTSIKRHIAKMNETVVNDRSPPLRPLRSRKVVLRAVFLSTLLFELTQLETKSLETLKFQGRIGKRGCEQLKPPTKCNNSLSIGTQESLIIFNGHLHKFFHIQVLLQLPMIDRDVFSTWLVEALKHFSNIFDLIYLEPCRRDI